MLAKKFGLFGSRESEVFHILRARYERVKYGKLSSRDPKSPYFCKHVFNFLGFCHFPFIFFAILILEFYGAWHRIFFFCRQKKWKFLCRKHKRTTDTESDRNSENKFLGLENTVGPVENLWGCGLYVRLMKRVKGKLTPAYKLYYAKVFLSKIRHK